MSKTCTHMATIRDVTPSALGCEECLETGDVWVHLRICRTCGHVGCCDQSPNRHATKHYHATQHPIIEGYDPPEGWGWCYVDEAMFDLSDRMTPHNGRIPRYYLLGLKCSAACAAHLAPRASRVESRRQKGNGSDDNLLQKIRNRVKLAP
jgi:Zn-finger in ubiquitin-hydrolases and other protein